MVEDVRHLHCSVANVFPIFRTIVFPIFRAFLNVFRLVFVLARADRERTDSDGGEKMNEREQVTFLSRHLMVRFPRLHRFFPRSGPSTRRQIPERKMRDPKIAEVLPTWR